MNTTADHDAEEVSSIIETDSRTVSRKTAATTLLDYIHRLQHGEFDGRVSEFLVDAHMHLGQVGDSWVSLADYDQITGVSGDVPPAEGVPKQQQQQGGLVVVEAIHEDPLEELRVWERMLGASGRRVRYVAGIDMLSADLIMTQHLSALAGCPRVVGVRHILNYHPDLPHRAWPRVTCYVERSPQFRKNFAALAAHRLSFDLQINYEQVTEELCALLESHPDVPVCVDHMLVPQFDGGDARNRDLWRGAAARLASIPHVYVKLSMTPLYSREAREKWWLPGNHVLRAEVASAVRLLVSLFGPHRCMYASNAPVDQRDYGMPFRVQLRTLCDWIGEENAAQILQKTALSFYRF